MALNLAAVAVLGVFAGTLLRHTAGAISAMMAVLLVLGGYTAAAWLVAARLLHRRDT